MQGSLFQVAGIALWQAPERLPGAGAMVFRLCSVINEPHRTGPARTCANTSTPF